MTENGKYTLTQAASKLQLTEFYVRKCIREGKIQAASELIPNTRIERYVIEAAEIERFAAREKANVGKRPDGRNKYTLYANDAELKQIRAMMTDLGLNEKLLSRANPPKAGEKVN